MKTLTGILATLLSAYLVLVPVKAATPAQPAYPRFAIRLIDETADPRTQCPADDDWFANSTIGLGQPGSHCLTRNTGIMGELVEAHVGTGADGQAVVLVTLTPRGADQFAALTRINTGRHFSVLLDGKVISGGLINGELTGGKFQISGYYTDGEAYGLAAEIMAAARAMGQNRQTKVSHREN